MQNNIGLINENNELTDENRVVWCEWVRQQVQDIGFLPEAIEGFTAEEYADEIAAYAAENLELVVEISDEMRKAYRKDFAKELVRVIENDGWYE